MLTKNIKITELVTNAIKRHNNNTVLDTNGELFDVNVRVVNQNRTLQIQGTTNQVIVNNTGALDLSQNRSWTLSLPQNIHTTATPTFNQLTLNNAGTSTSNAVRADRTLQIQGTTNQVIVSNTSDLNLTTNRSWTLSLPQNIHTGATPRFLRLGLGKAAHATHSLDTASSINIATSIYLGQKIEWTGSHADRFLRTSNFVAGFDLQGGDGVFLGHDDGMYNAYVDNLTVRKSLRAMEFIVDRTRSIMGTEIMSAAHGKVERTETGVGPFNMRVHLEDPDDTGLNPFIGNDRVLIQQVNTDSTTIVKHIRARVHAVGSLYIDLIWEDITPVEVPEPGDTVVQVWHPDETERQNIIVRSVTTANGALVYTRNGITSWSDFDQANLPTNNVEGVSYDGLGRFKAYTDSDNYIRKTASALDIRSETFRLDSTQDLGFGLGNTQLRLESGSNFGLRFHIDTEAVHGTPKMLSYGRVFTGLGSSTDRYGFAFFESSNALFELSDSVRQIAGWNFTTNELNKTSGNDTIAINSANLTFRATRNVSTTNRRYISMGNIYGTNNAYTGRHGIAYLLRDGSTTEERLFELSNTVQEIAGWTFTPSQFKSIKTNGTDYGIIMDSSVPAIRIYSPAYGDVPDDWIFSIDPTTVALPPTVQEVMDKSGININITYTDADVDTGYSANSQNDGVIVDFDNISLVASFNVEFSVSPQNLVSGTLYTINGTISVQGLDGANWVTMADPIFVSRIFSSANQGTSDNDYTIEVGNWAGYSQVRIRVESTISGDLGSGQDPFSTSLLVSGVTYKQYMPKMIINQRGMFARISPNTVISFADLVGGTVIAGGGGVQNFTELLDTPSSFVDSNFLRATSNSLEWRTPAQVRSDIGAEPVFSKGSLSVGTGVTFLSGNGSNRLVGSGTLVIGTVAASASVAGHVTTGAQTFAGLKDFSTGIRLLGDSTNLDFTSGGPLSIKRSTDNPFISFHDNSGTRIGFLQMRSDDTAALWLQENQAFRFGTNDSERMRILGNGNVGINQQNPAHKLDVSGGVRITEAQYGTGTQTMTSGTTAVASTAFVIQAIYTGSNVNISLPLASGQVGRLLYIHARDSAANYVVVSRSGSDTINGGTGSITFGNRASYLFYAMQSGVWVTLASN